MKSWGCCRNYVRLHAISSFYFQKRVPIKIPHFGQWGTIRTKEQITGIGFILQLLPTCLLGMCRSDTNCNLKLWYHIPTQAPITLYMLYPSRLPHQLFYQYRKARQFDYNNNSIGHPITCVVVHVNSTDCLYFLPHGNPGWYIGPTFYITNVTVYT